MNNVVVLMKKGEQNYVTRIEKYILFNINIIDYFLSPSFIKNVSVRLHGEAYKIIYVDCQNYYPSFCLRCSRVKNIFHGLLLIEICFNK